MYPPLPLRTIAFGAERSAAIALVAALLAGLLYAWSRAAISRNALTAAAFALLLLEDVDAKFLQTIHHFVDVLGTARAAEDRTAETLNI